MVTFSCGVALLFVSWLPQLEALSVRGLAADAQLHAGAGETIPETSSREWPVPYDAPWVGSRPSQAFSPGDTPVLFALRGYLMAVYPAAARWVSAAPQADLQNLYDGLDYYYHCVAEMYHEWRHAFACRDIRLNKEDSGTEMPPLPYLPPGAFYRAKLEDFQASQPYSHNTPVFVSTFQTTSNWLRAWVSQKGIFKGPAPSGANPLAIQRYVWYPNGYAADVKATEDDKDGIIVGGWPEVPRATSQRHLNVSEQLFVGERFFKGLKDGDFLEVEQQGGPYVRTAGLWGRVWRGTGVFMRLRQPLVAMNSATALLELLRQAERQGAKKVGSETQLLLDWFEEAYGLQQVKTQLIRKHSSSGSKAEVLLAAAIRQMAVGVEANLVRQVVDELKPTELAEILSVKQPAARSISFARYWALGLRRNVAAEGQPAWRSLDHALATLASNLGFGSIVLVASPDANRLLAQEVLDLDVPSSRLQELRNPDKYGRFELSSDAAGLLEHWKATEKFQLRDPTPGAAAPLACDLSGLTRERCAKGCWLRCPGTASQSTSEVAVPASKLPLVGLEYLTIPTPSNATLALAAEKNSDQATTAQCSDIALGTEATRALAEEAAPASAAYAEVVPTWPREPRPPAERRCRALGRNFEAFDPVPSFRIQRAYELEATLEHYNRPCTLCDVQEKPSSWPAELGTLSGRQLLMDGFLVQNSTGLVRSLERPVQDTVALEPAKEDETRYNTLGAFGCPCNLLHNDTHFLLYYRSRPFTQGLATSVDGLTWHRSPHQPEARGFRFPLTGEMCMLDDQHEQDKSRRFKVGYNCFPGRREQADLLCLASSADGVKWDSVGHVEGVAATDTYPCLHHDRPGSSYDVVLRENFASVKRWRGIRGIQHLRMNLNFSMIQNSEGAMPTLRPKLEKRSSWYFDLEGKDELYRRQAYSLTRTAYAGLYLGLAQVLEYPKLRTQRGDQLDVYLATSRDGEAWDFGWVYAGQRLLPDGTERTERGNRSSGSGSGAGGAGGSGGAGGGRGQPDAKWQMVGAQLVTFGGHHHLVYEKNAGGHDGRWHHQSKIHVVRFKEGRLAHLRTAEGQSGGEVTTKPFIFDGDTLAVDARVAGGAQIWVEALDADGNSLSRSAPLQSVDGLVAVSWGSKGDSTVPLASGTKVQLRFSLQGGAALFGFQPMKLGAVAASASPASASPASAPSAVARVAAAASASPKGKAATPVTSASPAAGEVVLPEVYVTLTDGDSDFYLPGLKAFAASLLQTNTTRPLVVITTGKPSDALVQLAGCLKFKLWQGQPINNPYKFENPRFARVFDKLNVWALPARRAVYLDVDTVVLRNIDELFSRGPPFRAAPGVFNKEQFNSGMFVVEPSKAVYDDMLSQLGVLQGKDIYADQGFLNAYFRDAWKLQGARLPETFNVLKLAEDHPEVFDLKAVRVLHMVGPKPWAADSDNDKFPKSLAAWKGALAYFEQYARRARCSA